MPPAATRETNPQSLLGISTMADFYPPAAVCSRSPCIAPRGSLSLHNTPQPNISRTSRSLSRAASCRSLPMQEPSNTSLLRGYQQPSAAGASAAVAAAGGGCGNGAIASKSRSSSRGAPQTRGAATPNSSRVGTAAAASATSSAVYGDAADDGEDMGGAGGGGGLLSWPSTVSAGAVTAGGGLLGEPSEAQSMASLGNRWVCSTPSSGLIMLCFTAAVIPCWCLQNL